MIKEEFFKQNEKEVVKRYSDKNVYIQNEKGVNYASAVDLVEVEHIYTETDIVIPSEDNS